ncbi:SprT-like protease [Microbacterium phage Zeta1847]|uniref:SprT-like protease n=1 Tax=Microbacterium phage Zeta1847 TaxID=2201444 RepID=A0A2Z4QA09_9CAUD|nr:SprT-like protease [Microbacterium phage Zeta1847]AWY06679.1 SprT-like protease [Microbacterium phage Zeta1847]
MLADLRTSTYACKLEDMTNTTDTTAPKFSTREEWLTAAIEALRPIFAAAGAELPAVRVSVGWPGGAGRKNSVIGQCWATAASSDKVAQLFISPVLDDAVRVLDVLVHELVHAVDDCQSGHKGAFAKLAKAVGLEGKMTATVAGDELKAKLEAIAAELGAYPHAAIIPALSGVKKQSTRMLKVECTEGSGYIVRMTRKWLDEFGEPSCPCHGERMAEAA